MHPRRRPGTQPRLQPWILPALGVFCVFMIYLNRRAFRYVAPPTAGNLAGSVRYETKVDPSAHGMISQLDRAHCQSSLQTSPLEAFETSTPLPALNTTAWHYRLKNLDVMKNTSFVDDAVLLLVVYNNKDSWGKGRSVRDFLQLVESFDYPTHKLSLGLLTSSLEEYILLKRMFQRILLTQFAEVTITFRDDFNIKIASHAARKADNIQKERRRMLARYRNYALAQSLESWHSHVVWIDSDIVSIPPALVTKMVHAKLDILEPLCHLVGSTQDYDLNAWLGQRAVPTDDELAAMHDGTLFVPHDGPGMLHMNDMRGHEYHPLDSVGGTMLYVKADVHRQGVVFPPHYIIGSEWKHEGYDGIETEGVCYVAGMLGYKCYAMPQDIIYHI
ncbi:Aste57867_14618 [Aphanomyces stellatus]|uniref:Aste57867_14618 protein n=1 Tax=Aphanomyces stellatus TaxID=120398 RepID=A0A485L3T2_9STRA|nr:hypothetical protein As57867_014564 [Aphanomyces stellatus]VFT91437.1 Aste57867_14618 [Aphanomyces stellatus]